MNDKPTYEALEQRIGALEKALLSTRQAEKALRECRESDRHNRRLFEHATIGMALCGMDGALMDVNRGFAEIIGRSVEETLRLKYGDIAARHYAEEDQHPIEILEKTGRYGPYEKEYVHKDGHSVPVRLSGVAVDGSGEPLVLYTVEDITEQVKARKEQEYFESQLRQMQKMEAVGTLAGGIAHDFNNILCSMMGYITLVRDQLPEHSQSREDLGLAMQAGEKAETLISQIFTFSRQGDKGLGPLQIGSFVKESLNMLRSALPATIEIRSKIDVGNRAILADPTQIHQMIMNLCSNAADAMETAGGILDVNLTEAEIHEPFSAVHDIKPGQCVKLTVRDSGSGIPHDIQDQIFDPFFTTKPVGKGTGLGLSSVHGIVKNHRGAVTAKSQAGAGTTFEVFFPVLDPVAATAEVPVREDAESPVRVREHILFIDDETSLVSIGTRVLRKLGYDVQGTTSSPEALALFRSNPHRFDLVMVDETMPVMTGSQLAAEMLMLRPDLRIILMTGFDIENVIEKTKALGVSKYLPKPIKYHQLGGIVRQALGK